MSDNIVHAENTTETLTSRSSPVQPIHGSIVKAICEIMQTVESVSKSQRNAHGGYNFASTDDIYAAVTRKMGHVGLVLITREDACEIVRVEKDGKVSQWARLTFSFVLATSEGTWADANARRTLFIQVTGAQTFQAAQSYAEKAFLRSLFKLPTGDMDLDSMPQSDTEEGQIALNASPRRKSSSSAKKDGTDKTFNEIRRDISGALNAEHLRHIRENWADEWSTAPARWHEILEDEYADKIEALSSKVSA